MVWRGYLAAKYLPSCTRRFRRFLTFYLPVSHKCCENLSLKQFSLIVTKTKTISLTVVVIWNFSLPEILGPSDAGYTTVLIELYSDFDEFCENGAFTASTNANPYHLVLQILRTWHFWAAPNNFIKFSLCICRSHERQNENFDFYFSADCCLNFRWVYYLFLSTIFLFEPVNETSPKENLKSVTALN